MTPQVFSAGVYLPSFSSWRVLSDVFRTRNWAWPLAILFSSMRESLPLPAHFGFGDDGGGSVSSGPGHNARAPCRWQTVTQAGTGNGYGLRQWDFHWNWLRTAQRLLVAPVIPDGGADD